MCKFFFSSEPEGPLTQTAEVRIETLRTFNKVHAGPWESWKPLNFTSLFSMKVLEFLLSLENPWISWIFIFKEHYRNMRLRRGRVNFYKVRVHFLAHLKSLSICVTLKVTTNWQRRRKGCWSHHFDKGSCTKLSAPLEALAPAMFPFSHHFDPPISLWTCLIYISNRQCGPLKIHLQFWSESLWKPSNVLSYPPPAWNLFKESP